MRRVAISNAGTAGRRGISPETARSPSPTNGGGNKTAAEVAGVEVDAVMLASKAAAASGVSRTAQSAGRTTHLRIARTRRSRAPCAGPMPATRMRSATSASRGPSRARSTSTPRTRAFASSAERSPAHSPTSQASAKRPRLMCIVSRTSPSRPC